MAGNQPKTSQSVIQQIKQDFQLGNYKSIAELASRYSVHPKSLQARIARENWNQKKEELLSKVEAKIEQKALNEAESWLKKVKERTSVDWNIIDRSIDNVGSEVDPDMMLTSIRARKLLDDMHRRSLGMTDPGHQLDITSKGQSIGESLVSAIAKLREDKSLPIITDADADRILECEIVDDNSDKLKS